MVLPTLRAADPRLGGGAHPRLPLPGRVEAGCDVSVVVLQAVIFMAGAVAAALDGSTWVALILGVVGGFDLGLLVAYLLRNAR